jgi:glucose-6-phosphate-specific signal transduction histidine kinase
MTARTRRWSSSVSGTCSFIRMLRTCFSTVPSVTQSCRAMPALHLRVRDDGVGGADPVRGSGLIGLNDRVEALGGTVRIDSPAGKGTSLFVTLPIAGG